jgi:hypothetical protein
MIPEAPREDVSVLTDEPWTIRYEEMRREVVAMSCASDHTYGYALFARRGLVAWMKAWPRPAPGSSRDPGSSRTVDGVTPSAHLLRSAASLLVNMILILDAPTEVSHGQ